MSSEPQSHTKEAERAALANIPLHELYQRRVVLLRELNALEDTIKELEATAAKQSAMLTTSLAEALEGRLRALHETSPEPRRGTDSPSSPTTTATLSLEEMFKDTMRRSASLLATAFENLTPVEASVVNDATSELTFVPPMSVAEEVRRVTTAYALTLLRRGTASLEGLKECTDIAGLVCNPASFDAEEVLTNRALYALKKSSFPSSAVETTGTAPKPSNHSDAFSRHFSRLARLHFRQIFIAEVVRHGRQLIGDALGSNLLQRVVPLLLPGDKLPGCGVRGAASSGRVFLWYNIDGAGAEGADASIASSQTSFVPLVSLAEADPALWDLSYQLAYVKGAHTNVNREEQLPPYASGAAIHFVREESPSEIMLLVAALGSMDTVSPSQSSLAVPSLPSLADAACHTHGTRAVLKLAESLFTVSEYESFLRVGATERDTDVAAEDDGANQKMLGGPAATTGKLRLGSKFISLLTDMNGNSVVNALLSSDLLTDSVPPTTPALVSNNNSQAAPTTGLSSLGSLAAEAIRSEVYGVIAAKCLDVCQSRQGCCTIQRCITSAPHQYKQQMVDAVLSNALRLVQDPFGNYVIQFLLDGTTSASPAGDGDNEDGDAGPKSKAPSRQQGAKGGAGGKKQQSQYTNLIIRQLLHHIPALSTNKFSSNVIEKCLRSAAHDVKQLLIDELTDPQVLPRLLVDGFANYVIQTAIASAADDAQFRQLRDAIAPLQHLLKNSPFGGKIETKLERRQRELQSNRKRTHANASAITNSTNNNIINKGSTNANQSNQHRGGTGAAGGSRKGGHKADANNRNNRDVSGPIHNPIGSMEGGYTVSASVPPGVHFYSQNSPAQTMDFHHYQLRPAVTVVGAGPSAIASNNTKHASQSPSSGLSLLPSYAQTDPNEHHSHAYHTSATANPHSNAIPSESLPHIPSMYGHSFPQGQGGNSAMPIFISPGVIDGSNININRNGGGAPISLPNGGYTLMGKVHTGQDDANKGQSYFYHHQLQHEQPHRQSNTAHNFGGVGANNNPSHFIGGSPIPPIGGASDHTYTGRGKDMYPSHRQQPTDRNNRDTGKYEAHADPSLLFGFPMGGPDKNQQQQQSRFTDTQGHRFFVN